MAVKTIGLEDLDKLGIDPETQQLFWNGQEIVTVLSVPWWVQVSAVAAAIATVIMAFSMIVPQIIQLVHWYTQSPK